MGAAPSVGGVVAHHLRIGQREVDVVAAVDGQIVNASLADGVGRRTARGLHQFRLRRNLNHFLAACDGEGDGEIHETSRP